MPLEQKGLWTLVPVVVLFGAFAVSCWVELKRGQQDHHDASTSSTGSEMRRRIQKLLFVANAARCVCLSGEIMLYERGQCPADRLCALARCGPDLLFLTTYSVLILFWAQLSDMATGVRLPLLRPAFFVANASLYLAFLLVLVLSATILSTLQVLQALFYVLGSFYVLATFFLLQYGWRMMHFSHTVLPAVVLRRLVVLCCVLSLVFLLHATYALGVASRLLPWENGYPPQLDPQTFDALYYPSLELLPSVAILMSIHKKKGHPTQPTIYPYLDPTGYQIRGGAYGATPGHRLSNSGESHVMMGYGGPNSVVKEGVNGGIMGLWPLQMDALPIASYQADGRT